IGKSRRQFGPLRLERTNILAPMLPGKRSTRCSDANVPNIDAGANMLQITNRTEKADKGARLESCRIFDKKHRAPGDLLKYRLHFPGRGDISIPTASQSGVIMQHHSLNLSCCGSRQRSYSCLGLLFDQVKVSRQMDNDRGVVSRAK